MRPTWSGPTATVKEVRRPRGPEELREHTRGTLGPLHHLAHGVLKSPGEAGPQTKRLTDLGREAHLLGVG